MQRRPVPTAADIVEEPVKPHWLSLPELRRTGSYQLELAERLLAVRFLPGKLLLE